MRRIYEQARTVIAWLGEPAEDSEKAIALIHNFEEAHDVVTERVVPITPQILRDCW
jgi:hypothetical protein